MTDEPHSSAFSHLISSGYPEDEDTRLRVMIVGADTLLDYSVTSLLMDEPDLRVVGVTYRAEEDFIHQVTDFQPEVIVICESGEFGAATITGLLSRKEVVPRCIVMVARLDNNTLDVCERVTLMHRHDLVKIIHRVDRLIRFE